MTLRLENTIKRKEITETGFFSDLQNISYQLDRQSLSKAIRIIEVEKDITLKSGIHDKTGLKYTVFCIAKSKVKSNIPSLKSLGRISGMFNIKLSELIKMGEEIYEQNKEEEKNKILSESVRKKQNNWRIY